MADRTERATVGRVELAYETFGDIDNPPLLLIAGLATQMLGWDEQFCMQLADNGFRVIRMARSQFAIAPRDFAHAEREERVCRAG